MQGSVPRMIIDHEFEGTGPFCETVIVGRCAGSPETGYLTMEIGCGYPRGMHPDGPQPVRKTAGA